MRPGNSSWRKNGRRPNRPGQGHHSSATSAGASSGRPGSGRRRRGGAGGRGRYNNRRPQAQHPLSKEEQLVNRYLTLLDQHLQTRTKYYDAFEHPDYHRRMKWERAFYQGLHELRQFEARLSPEERSLLEKHTNGLKLDLTYSENRQLLDGPSEKFRGEIEDPHFLISQKEAMKQYKDDREESNGTADDYHNYKNSR